MKPKNEASNLKPLSLKPGFLSLVNKGLAFPFIGLIFLYKKAFSPLFPASCRFTPSCSEYALQAFKKYGFLKGFRLTAWRIMRCQPFHPGGRDPLP